MDAPPDYCEAAKGLHYRLVSRRTSWIYFKELSKGREGVTIRNP